MPQVCGKPRRPYLSPLYLRLTLRAKHARPACQTLSGHRAAEAGSLRCGAARLERGAGPFIPITAQRRISVAATVPPSLSTPLQLVPTASLRDALYHHGDLVVRKAPEPAAPRNSRREQLRLRRDVRHRGRRRGKPAVVASRAACSRIPAVSQSTCPSLLFLIQGSKAPVPEKARAVSPLSRGRWCGGGRAVRATCGRCTRTCGTAPRPSTRSPASRRAPCS